MKIINLPLQMVKFRKFAEKLNATQSILYIILNVKCKKKHILETIGDNGKRLEVRINQLISDCKTRVSLCSFQCHVYDCGI